MPASEAAQHLRILLLTRSYPEDGNLYQYPFVHRRVLAYRAAGHDVLVFRPGEREPASRHLFDGSECWTGGAGAFDTAVAQFRPDVIAAHGFCETMWPTLKRVAGVVPVQAWLHGSEIPAFFRTQAACIADPLQRQRALAGVEERSSFWRGFLGAIPNRFGLVFVSNSAVDMMREDVGGLIDDAEVAVIPNPIDTDLFAYCAKTPEDRFAVLSIRPFDSRTYGNDMTVAAIRSIAARGDSDRMRFTIIGDGPLFDETLAPLAGIRNVAIQRRFIDQGEIAAEHRRNGIFLVPTRLDTQGVSRDEAMASGLVPVTNAVSAVPEFVDQSCAALAPADNPEALADALWAMVADPALFLSRSVAAAERVRRQSGYDCIIPAELSLLAEARRA
jgi:glycosyltransferase involved in cell wall biosynthesis